MITESRVGFVDLPFLNPIEVSSLIFLAKNMCFILRQGHTLNPLFTLHDRGTH